jgi:probable rRNA maturation factor
LEVEVSVLVHPELRGKVDEARLNETLVKLLTGEGLDKSITAALLVTTDEAVRRLNLIYRGQDVETDVLAFGMQGGEERFISPPSGPVHLGDVVISYPRAVVQAEEHGQTVEEELDRLAVHGALHLLGYEDESDEDRRRMWHKQEAVLRHLRKME